MKDTFNIILKKDDEEYEFGEVSNEIFDDVLKGISELIMKLEK